MTDPRRSTYTVVRVLYLMHRTTETSVDATSLAHMAKETGGKDAYMAPQAITGMLDSLKAWGLATPLPDHGKALDTLRKYVLTIKGEQVAGMLFDEAAAAPFLDPFSWSWKDDKSRFKKDMIVRVLEHLGPSTIEEIQAMTDMSRATIMSAFYDTQDVRKGRTYPSKYLVDSGAVSAVDGVFTLLNKRAYLPDVKPEVRINVPKLENEKLAALYALWCLATREDPNTVSQEFFSKEDVLLTGLLDAWVPIPLHVLTILVNMGLAETRPDFTFRLSHLGQLVFNCPPGLQVTLPGGTFDAPTLSTDSATPPVKAPVMTLADIGLLLDESDVPRKDEPFLAWDDEPEPDLDKILGQAPSNVVQIGAPDKAHLREEFYASLRACDLKDQEDPWSSPDPDPDPRLYDEDDDLDAEDLVEGPPVVDNVEEDQSFDALCEDIYGTPTPVVAPEFSILLDPELYQRLACLGILLGHKDDPAGTLATTLLTEALNRVVRAITPEIQ